PTAAVEAAQIIVANGPLASTHPRPYRTVPFRRTGSWSGTVSMWPMSRIVGASAGPRRPITLPAASIDVSRPQPGSAAVRYAASSASSPEGEEISTISRSNASGRVAIDLPGDPRAGAEAGVVQGRGSTSVGEDDVRHAGTPGGGGALELHLHA